MRTMLLLACAVLLSAADLPPAGTRLTISTRTNSAIEFRAAKGGLRPAIFTAAGEGDGVLTSSGTGLDGSFVLGSTALSLVVHGDRTRHLLGELVTEREATGKDGEKRQEAVGPDARIAVQSLSSFQVKGEGKDARLTATATATLTLGGKAIPLRGEVRVSPLGKGGVDGVDLRLSFTTTGSELGLKRDAQVPVIVDIYTRATPPPTAKPKK